ncbi:hypothetical protein AGR56_15650 [Clostridium sp. DMHC 10]|uniref:tetratricopeptide repeat protein n=1 Tax=Clostridium sp. DMHC 10 TaxID=747377 RepID=UPI00069F29AB|nr:tetratricopeptide repeat protein [Clostridium sp. DMHC 10]KOF57700.1 hypothetical protein AGR56_15650 [Clostridium sp. DMHC 10]
MRRNHITNYLILLILLAFSLSISGCSHKDKEIVVTKDVKMAAKSKQAENQVKKNIDLGNKLVDSGKYDEAKKAYDKAIELDKKDKQTYLTIKDKYLSKGKLQEAYDVVQEAITNNVDVENMKKLLVEVKQKIDTNEQAKNSQNAVAQSKQNTVLKPVQTESQAGDNSSSQQEDTVESIKTFGIVKNVYEHNGKRYISVIEGQFFKEPEAANEAAKDGLEFDEHRHYYIRQTSSIEDFEVSNNAKINVAKYIINSSSSDSSNQPVSYSQFKTLENTYKDSRGFFWIYLNKNRVVLRLETQFTP